MGRGGGGRPGHPVGSKKAKKLDKDDKGDGVSGNEEMRKLIIGTTVKTLYSFQLSPPKAKAKIYSSSDTETDSDDGSEVIHMISP